LPGADIACRPLVTRFLRAGPGMAAPGGGWLGSSVAAERAENERKRGFSRASGPSIMPCDDFRRGARAADWAGLENRCAGNRTEGSNPSPSAWKTLDLVTS